MHIQVRSEGDSPAQFTWLLAPPMDLKACQRREAVLDRLLRKVSPVLAWACNMMWT